MNLYLIATVSLLPFSPVSLPPETLLRDSCSEVTEYLEMHLTHQKRRGLTKEAATDNIKEFSKKYEITESIAVDFVQAVFDEKLYMEKYSRAFSEDCVNYLKRHPEIFEEKKQVVDKYKI